MKLRLKGKGLPALEGRHHGDLYLVVQVKVPDSHPAAIKKAAEALDGGYTAEVRKDLKL